MNVEVNGSLHCVANSAKTYKSNIAGYLWNPLKFVKYICIILASKHV